MSAAAHARWDGEDLVLRIHAQPRASRSEVAGAHGDALKVRIAAPPVDGEANDALCRFLAKTCGVPRSAVSVEAGESSRTKTIRVRTPRKVPAELEAPVR